MTIRGKKQVTIKIGELHASNEPTVIYTLLVRVWLFAYMMKKTG